MEVFFSFDGLIAEDYLKTHDRFTGVGCVFVWWKSHGASITFVHILFIFLKIILFFCS